MVKIAFAAVAPPRPVLMELTARPAKNPSGIKVGGDGRVKEGRGRGKRGREGTGWV